MIDVMIRTPSFEDKDQFLAAMQASQSLHYPWVRAPLTVKEFDQYIRQSQTQNQKSFLVMQANKIAGVFNISEIVFGCFQNAYLGFYSVADFAGKGLMSAGLKLVLKHFFCEMRLHRLEANIQPENLPSLRLVKANGFRCEGFSPRYLKINNEWRGHERWAITYEDFICNDKSVLQKDHIEITHYDSSWSASAKNEIEKIKTALPAHSVIDIQHVGSTAVPGLAAKPIIDIQVAVSSLVEMKIIAVPALQKLGYEYWQNNPDPERLFFAKGMPPYGEKRTHHIHIVEPTSKHWRDKIAFRDYLIAHPNIAREYEQLKIKFAQEHTYDREKYTDAKTQFIIKVLQLVNKG